MGKPITNDFNTGNTILKFFPYQAAAGLVAADGVSAGADGRKVVKAGTPYPANDATCLGYLLVDVDVTNGDAPGSYVFEGTIDTAKLTANGVTVSAAAKNATPKVTFYEEPYGGN